jgi:rSAM/selenodomain-associated transferase 1
MIPALSVFLKAPRPGAVKTRLAAQVGDRQALRLYRLMAARALAAAREVGFDTTIWFTPPDAAAEVRFWLGDGWKLAPQASGDFGARLIAAEQSVERGRSWLAIGVDCPSLDAALLRVAAAVVARDEIVLGPTYDGGYYLIGGRTPLPAVFAGISWSTSGVLAETRARLERAQLPWRELPMLRDVDTADDARAEGLLT